MKVNAYDDFREKPTPANAIRLAIADHKAYAGGPMGTDWGFIAALQTALEVIEQQDFVPTRAAQISRMEKHS